MTTAGFFEVRVRGADRRDHHLFCILEQEADDLGGSSIVVIDGLSKPVRQSADPRDYQRAPDGHISHCGVYRALRFLACHRKAAGHRYER